MKPLNAEQYKHLKENYSDALTLAKQTMLANGVDDLIPMYEELTGTEMNRNCSDCRLDMMILFYLAVISYETSVKVAENGKETITKKLKANGK